MSLELLAHGSGQADSFEKRVQWFFLRSRAYRCALEGVRLIGVVVSLAAGGVRLIESADTKTG